MSKQEFPSIISFEVCDNCKKHTWCTRHDPKKYDFFYEEVKKSIEKETPEMKVVRNQLSQKPRIGAFEIYVGEHYFFSKINTGLWPNAPLVAKQIKDFLKDLKDKKDISKYIVKVKGPTYMFPNVMIFEGPKPEIKKEDAPKKAETKKDETKKDETKKDETKSTKK